MLTNEVSFLPLNSCSVVPQMLLLKRVGWVRGMCRTAPKQHHVYPRETRSAIYMTALGVEPAIQEETKLKSQ